MIHWFNIVFYLVNWLAAVAGAGHGLWWPGLALFGLFAAWQFATTAWPRADACLVAGIGLLGFAIDSAFAQSGLMEFSTALPWPHLAPLWMVVLWTSFALSLNHSLAFVQARPRLAVVLGACGAPFAYWAAGRGWHALGFGERPTLTFALVAVAWAVLMPLLSRLALRLRQLDAAASAAPVRP
jgi:hypothetical protein